MNQFAQIAHILRKDMRRCWPEALLSVALTTALVVVYPLRWSALPALTPRIAIDLSMNLALLGTGSVALVVAGWALLISRVIHEDGLVGNRPFWLTVPYEWKSLLAAKGLFLAFALYVPLVVAQWLLLAAAGLGSLANVPGLLFNLLLITGFVVLPLVAIATVTSNFLRMAFTLLGTALLGVVAVVVISLPRYSYVRDNWNRLSLLARENLTDPGHSLSSAGGQQPLKAALLFAAVCGAVIVLQYARRKTRAGRVMLLALPLALAVGGVVKAHFAPSADAQIEHDYATLAAGEEAPLQLSYGADEKHHLGVLRGMSDFGVPTAALNIPLHVSEVAKGTALVVDHEVVTLEAEDGFRWRTEADNFIGSGIAPGSSVDDVVHDSRVFFEMPEAVYTRFATGPVTVRITQAVTELQEIHSIQVAMPAREVAVPGFGICRVEAEGNAALQCRSALREPRKTYLTVETTETPCVSPQTEIYLSQAYPAWPGQLDQETAEFGIVPIHFVEISGALGVLKLPEYQKWHLCTGAPITFTQYRFKRRVQVKLTIPGLLFPAEGHASK